MTLPEHIHWGHDGLLIENRSLKELAQRFGTPVYVVSAAALRHAAETLRQLIEGCCPDALISYAYKSNALPGVCAVFRDEGIGAEVSSLTELNLALDLGVEPTVIVFNGPAKSDAALERAMEAGVGYLNADSFDELRRINVLALKRGCEAKVGLRIGPKAAHDLHGRPTRFGVDCADDFALHCLREARELECVRICGVQFHLGTQIRSSCSFIRAISEAVELVSRALDENLMEASYLDLGGGFAIKPSTCRAEVEAYGDTQVEESLVERILEYAARAIETLAPSAPRIIVEPGRLLVAQSAVLLTRIVGELTHKAVGGFILDAGQNMVSSNLTLKIFHDVLPQKVLDRNATPTNLFGCLCYESDVIALGLPLPSLAVGDLLAILDCGAYDIALASSFIVPRPAVIFLNSSSITCDPRSDQANFMRTTVAN